MTDNEQAVHRVMRRRESGLYTLANVGDNAKAPDLLIGSVDEWTNEVDIDGLFDPISSTTFDLEAVARIASLRIDQEPVDELLLASLVGFDATAQLLAGADEVELAATRTTSVASQLARLLTLCRAPVQRSHRVEWRATALALAASLADDGFAMSAIVQSQAVELNAALARVDDPLALVRANAAVARGVRLCDVWLDLLDDPGLIRRLVADLPDPTDTTMADLEQAPAYRGDLAFRGHIPDTEAPAEPAIALPAFRGGPTLGAEGPGDAEAEGWSQPLVWRLVAEEFLPDDEQFDDAIGIEQRDDAVMITVEGESAGCPALYMRLMRGSETRSFASLVPDADGWAGHMPLPRDYSGPLDRIEVVDRLERPTNLDEATEVDHQWRLVKLARDIALRPASGEAD